MVSGYYSMPNFLRPSDFHTLIHQVVLCHTGRLLKMSFPCCKIFRVLQRILYYASPLYVLLPSSLPLALSISYVNYALGSGSGVWPT